MIELNGHVSQMFRSTEKPPRFEARKSAQATEASGTSSQKPDRSAAAFGPLSAPPVINFEYVPSGRLNLNQDERQRLIDFFE